MALKKKRKKKPIAPLVAERPADARRPDSSGGGGAWFGTEDRLTDPTSQQLGDPGNVGAGISAPNWTSDSGKPKTPAQEFVAAVISGERDQIEAAYGKVGMSDAPAIKSAFLAMPKEQRTLVLAHVSANKDLFNPIAYGAFETMMKTAPQYAPSAGGGAVDAVNMMGAGGNLGAAGGGRVFQDQHGTRSRPISGKLSQVLDAAANSAGVDVHIFSGGQAAKGTEGPRTGSTRHDLGNAADLSLWKDGRQLKETNPADLPIIQAFVKASVEAGATGIGGGVGYMGDGNLHVGFDRSELKGAGLTLWGPGESSKTTPAWLKQAVTGATLRELPVNPAADPFGVVRMQTAGAASGYKPPAITDISGKQDFGGLKPLEAVEGLIMHHTGPVKDVAGVVNAFGTKHDPGDPESNYPAQFVIDRDGKIYQTIPTGFTGRQIQSTGKNLDSGESKYPSVTKLHLSNDNTIGVEIIAADDAHVLPAQVEAAKQLYSYLSSDPAAAAWKANALTKDQVYGHGQVNPGHKMPSEGMTAVAAIKSLPKPVSVADNSEDPFGVVRMKDAAAAKPMAYAPAAAKGGGGSGGTPEARSVRDLMIAGRADLGVKPLPAHVAAGAVGNMMQESYANLRPDAKGAGGEIGIGQWMPDRYANMVAWTKANGLDPNSREGQALFYSHELQQDAKTMAQLAGAKTPGDAAKVIATSFERAGNPMMDKRIGFANAMADGAPAVIAGGAAQDVTTGGAKSVGDGARLASAIRASGGLRKGSRDTAANKALQASLATLAVGDRIGASLKPDGVFGNRTKEAVKNYQARVGIKPDGVVGPQTLAHMNADMRDLNFGVNVGTEGSPELAGQVPRDFAAGAAAAAVTVDPRVAGSFGASASFTLNAVISHQADPVTFASERNWDAASARIANTLRDNARMDEEVRAAMGKAGKQSFIQPIESDASAVPKTLSEWLGPRPGDPIQEHQQPAETGFQADVSRTWDRVKSAYDIETWLGAPLTMDNPSSSSSGSMSDPFQSSGSQDFTSGGSSGSDFDSFASGMSQTYQTVQSGGSVFDSNIGSSSFGGSSTTTQTDAAGRVLGGI